MLKLILRRVIVAIPTLILVSMIVFMLQKILPGDAVLTMAGEERDPAVLDYLREKYRLNDPLPMQYVAWATQVVQGDLGKSLRTDVPVTTLIAQKLPVTLQLAAMAMFFALLVGIPMGMPTSSAKNMAMAASCRVTGSFWAISVVTGTSVRSDLPRSPCTTWVAQATYCIGKGSFRRYFSRR